jgi:hypothetical protein
LEYLGPLDSQYDLLLLAERHLDPEMLLDLRLNPRHCFYLRLHRVLPFDLQQCAQNHQLVTDFLAESDLYYLSAIDSGVHFAAVIPMRHL